MKDHKKKILTAAAFLIAAGLVFGLTGSRDSARELDDTGAIVMNSGGNREPGEQAEDENISAPENNTPEDRRDVENSEKSGVYVYICGEVIKPGVYELSGDSRIYDENVIEIKSGGIYRSLHYIIKYRGYYVEIQARTLFEEGWSEVDHDIVYPYHKDDVMLRDFSRLLNRLSGMADEMSSYFRRMKVEKEIEEVLLGEYKEDKEAKLLASMRELLGKEER